MNPAAIIDWQSALAVLVVGVAVGWALLWKARRSAPPATGANALDQRDLEARRDALLRQLRELDDTASKFTPEQLARERYALELASATAMRDLDRRAPARGAAAARAAGDAGAPVAVAGSVNRGAMRGFLWGTVTAAAIGLLLFFVNRAATPREGGGAVTGTAGRMSGPEAAPGGMGAAGLPPAGSDDIEARLASAREHLTKQDLMGVWNDTKFVLEREPGNPRALSYQALVRLSMGQADVAESMLKRAMATDPDLLDAHLHLAVVYARTGRGAQADATLRAAMSKFPERREGLLALMKELKETAADEAPNPAAVGAHAGVLPPDQAAPAMETADGRPGAPPKRGASSDAGTTAGLSGMVELDPALRGRFPGGMVFVIVRAVGVTSGPPMAVKRFSAASLPGAFSITSADSMLGQELPEHVRIEARLDPDGDPLTRAATDPQARLDDVKLGSAGLRLVLK